MNRCFGLVAIALPLWGIPSHAVDVIFPTDPRIIRANSYLENKIEWQTAIELYEEVIAEDPNHAVARQWLARELGEETADDRPPLAADQTDP